MDKQDFWTIIDAVHAESGGDLDRKCTLLEMRLHSLADDEIIDFIDHFDAADAAAYTWPLWGAAYIMHGGCSDDAFIDFRATLISQGQDIYEGALADPDSLADLDVDNEEQICYEGFQYLAGEVANKKSIDLPQRAFRLPDNPTGTAWDEEELESLFPRLWAKYCIRADQDDKGPPRKPWWQFWS